MLSLKAARKLDVGGERKLPDYPSESLPRLQVLSPSSSLLRSNQCWKFSQNIVCSTNSAVAVFSKVKMKSAYLWNYFKLIY